MGPAFPRWAPGKRRAANGCRNGWSIVAHLAAGKRLKTSNVQGACPRSMPFAAGLLLERDAQPCADHGCTRESDHSGRVVSYFETIPAAGIRVHHLHLGV